METTTQTPKKDFSEWIDRFGPQLEQYTAKHDREDSFVEENYRLIKEEGLLRAMVPEELGGYGVPHSEMCEVLRKMAHHCPSTALALSMHQHLIGANAWKFKRGQGGEGPLKKVAENNLVLISTGGRDWLESNGKMEKTGDGYLFSAEKHFASQAAIGDILVTSAPYHHPEKGWQVLHFPVLMKAEGVEVQSNWYTLGMRGTGSHSVKLNRVFVPEKAVVLTRLRGEYHPFWNVVLTVAMPLIMAVYTGIAEKAAQLALQVAREKRDRPPHLPFLIGEMHNHLTTAQVVLKDMVALTNNFDFEPNDETGVATLTRKTLVANACKSTVGKAMEATGGRSFFRAFELERLFRDVQAGHFHPLPEKEQQHFCSTFWLGKD